MSQHWSHTPEGKPSSRQRLTHQCGDSKMEEADYKSPISWNHQPHRKHLEGNQAYYRSTQASSVQGETPRPPESKMEEDDYQNPVHYSPENFGANPANQYSAQASSIQRGMPQPRGLQLEKGRSTHPVPDYYHQTGSAAMEGYASYQQMKQEQIFRSVQAQKQMVYDVYGNVITALEEYEERENRKSKTRHSNPLPKSKIYIPDQSWKTDLDVKANVQSQLVVFESLLFSACDPNIKEEVVGEIKQTTLMWMAVRMENGIKRGETDDFASQLYEILQKGKTEHPKTFSEKPTIDQKGMRTTFQNFLKGNHKRAELDAGFRNDPNKKAALPWVRSGSSIDAGIKRINAINPGLVDPEDGFETSLR